jgi:hypothetical protein
MKKYHGRPRDSVRTRSGIDEMCDCYDDLGDSKWLGHQLAIWNAF